uniref:Nuclear protein, ataxia-telangiectasia locus n=1 Tax=Neolamprologus brichardi TaxID=32507 RepID=A0A3Q4M4H2_NEOBR
MLLPSDVARLVLGYLQEEGLSATSQAFIHESPNLKEYAEHTTGDGTIPACVFSIFGKSLTTILNEYVAAKTKESCHEVPVMMTSLWKKLDFTLNQIKYKEKLLYCIRNDMLSVSSHSLQQLVIQNARDKILGDRSLQEKLAENINKILANEPMPQTSKGSSSTVETDQSIDEILGLQGEIHMSDDAIHDILEQTESDPAFQALFDLFDYTLPVSTFSVISKSVLKTSSSTDTTASAASPSSAFIAAPSTATPAAPTSASTSASPRAAHASFTAASPASSSSSCALVAPPPAASVATTADLLTTSIPNTAATDSSNVMSLKIIISDNQDEGSSSDTALNQAISSISGDKIPTIYVSSPAKSVGCPETPKANMDEVAQAVSGLQSSEAFASPLSSKAGAVTASPLTGTSQAQQSYIIQLPLDATNPALQGASYFLVTEPPSTEAEGRQVVLPAGVSNGQSLPTNQYAVTTPTRSTSYSTGSALVLPSPVKPMMLPVSVVGPNPVGKVQMVSNQVRSCTEKNLGSQVVQPVSAGNTDQQDAEKGASHRRILCFDSSADVQPQTLVVRIRPTILGGNKPKRRVETVRCLASPQAGVSLVKEPFSLQQYQKDSAKKSSRKQDHNTHKQESQSASTSSADASKVEAGKKSESEKRSKSVERKCSQDAHKDNSKHKDSYNSRSESDSALKSGSRKDKEESSRKESAEKVPLKPREGRTEKKTPSQEMPNVTANKENEMKGSMQDQQPSSSASRDLSPPAVTQPASQSQSKVTKTPSKTSSLAKQAAEMLQDIQGLKSPSNPVKGLGASSSDLPGTGSKQEAPADCPRTPRQKGKVKDVEGTPKHLMPPNTPDVPGCSPASEAGSESSINMAAHTLMILSRAAIARTGSPLKDSLRQDGIGEKSPTSSKNSKKRKQPISASSPPPKKESKRSPTKKKDRERKKIIDYFPEDLDVDKFLSSLHYDE